ncbi:MAG TPA: uracil-DNA glycosylase family protein [Bacilli bacterium]|jgi:uracil-DNA glycosylase|nr:MAG: Uracil DNA glycosylase superfamily protein [Tenericutes bacterium ADurb.Bin140]HOE77609.1 uracil-DNA glycosylase family protein [Bacilli bacterium]
MDVEKIKQAIMADSMNKVFTDQGIEPLFKVSPEAEIVLVGQAPGRLAQATKMVWNDQSGERLRMWLGLSRKEFYESEKIAHMPMDFYYPGKGKNGDNPPRRGFAEKWHPLLLKEMPKVKTLVLIGSFAQKFYLKDKAKTLTETVKNYDKYLPDYFPLVHPSPLNLGWLKQNPWFEEEVIPVLRALIRQKFMHNE